MTTSARLLQFRAGFIEQVNSIIKEFQNTIIGPLITPSSFKELAPTVDLHLPASYFLVLNPIIATRWMHMNWYNWRPRYQSGLTKDSLMPRHLPVWYMLEYPLPYDATDMMCEFWVHIAKRWVPIALSLTFLGMRHAIRPITIMNGFR